MPEYTDIYIKCWQCRGTGKRPPNDEECHYCQGTGKILWGHLDVTDLNDKLNDIMDKCKDIFEKLNE